MVRIRIHTSPHDLEQLRGMWEFVSKRGQKTIFQNFDWNLLAARQFGDREAPVVVTAEASYGLAIVPAARSPKGTLRLLGEELFDYRNLLETGEQDVLRTALAALAPLGTPLEIAAVRDCDRSPALEGLELEPFNAAPGVDHAEISTEEFRWRHSRLARNMRRLQRQGFALKMHSGENSSLVRFIYAAKAERDPASLFHDPRRVDFMVKAARLQSSCFEIFTLESGAELAAALVTLREPTVRRFYTCFFSLEFAKLSPALALIHEITRQSLNSGLDCDYMTGEQGYKLRLATASMPLYRLRATSEQLAAMRHREIAVIG
jgi:CelD/BcsL family acetyltransferase involved in cellulose biosynthesis